MLHLAVEKQYTYIINVSIETHHCFLVRETLLLKLLIEWGAEVNSIFNDRTPLFIAVEHNDLAIVKVDDTSSLTVCRRLLSEDAHPK